MLNLITALVAMQFKLGAMGLQLAASHAEQPEIVTEYVTEYVPVTEYVTEYVTVPAETRECGVCGAHVTEWWQVRNDADTAFVDVCERCCERIEREGEHDDLD